MRRELIINLLFSILIMVAGVTQVLAGTISAPMVEFPAVFHFLTLAGDVIEVGPGVFQVEAAESWCRLVPDGEFFSRAVLLEANRGPH